MEFKKSFDIMEAAVLMDIYMYAKEHGISASKTAIEASERLRCLALGKGYDINKSFRSVPGIQNRLRTLASMYENKNSSGYPGTNIFAEIIDMYRNDNPRYTAILIEAKRLMQNKTDVICSETNEKEEIKHMTFWEWLSGQVTPNVYEELQDSYMFINTMLLQKRVLKQAILSTTEKSKLEFALSQTKKVFASVKTRYSANRLLQAYMQFLDTDTTETTLKEKDTPASEVKVETTPKPLTESRILFDLTNASQFEGTRPVDCTLCGEVLEGKVWNQILISITNRELRIHNPKMEELYHHSLLSEYSEYPYLLVDKPNGMNCKQLDNGYWVNVNYSIPSLMKQIKALCAHCGYSLEQMRFFGIPKYEGKITKEVKDNAPCISENILSAIRDFYSTGLRFEDTVIRLLEEKSGESIDENIKQALRKQMFCRGDEVYFLPDTILTKEQRELVNKEAILNQLSRFSCIDIGALWDICCSNGSSTCLRNAEDLERYLNYLMPDDVRIGNGLKTRIARKIGKSVNDSLKESAQMVVHTITDYGCITEEDLLQAYPIFSGSFLKELLEKYTDEVLPTIINDFLCYQTIESMGLDEEFSETILKTLEELDRLSICPSQEILHALLSVKLGYNVRDEYSIPDDKTFRRFISVYYTGSEKRNWKAGNFVGVNIENV